MSYRRALQFASTTLALALAAAPVGTRAEEPTAEGLDAPAAFARLKSLVGTWEGGEGDATVTVTYRLTGNGSALVETFFPGSDHEMLSVYHLDGETLRMTHYCAIGNQPRFVLDRDASSADELVFAFDGGTNLDPAKDMHIHEGRILLIDADHLRGEWTAFHEGKAAGTTPFEMTRAED